MAKKKTTKKSKRRSRRSTTPKAMKVMQNMAMVMVGGMTASVVGNILPIKDARIKALMPLLGGLALAVTSRRQMPQLIGMGMGTIGLASTLRQFIPGVPALAGDSMGYAQITESDIQRALGMGAITPEEAETLRRHPELMGIPETMAIPEVMGNPTNLADPAVGRVMDSEYGTDDNYQTPDSFN